MAAIKKLAVIGAGGWGTALARLAARKGYEVRIWSHEPEVASEINAFHGNKAYLSGVTLPPGLSATSDLGGALDGVDGVITAVPSRFMRSTISQLVPFWHRDFFLLNAAKGLEADTGKTLSQVIIESLPPLDPEKLAILSGPNHAEEVGRDVPSASVVASHTADTAAAWQDVLLTDSFRIYTNPDMLGVELAGSLKNVVALAAGMCDGLGFGDNTKAMVITRGLAEMIRLGSVMGASPLSFTGLSGLGDLMATAGSRHSRNRWAGEELGKGRTLQDILGSTRMVVEGVYTASAAMNLSARHQVEMPLAQTVSRILAGHIAAADAVLMLMRRNPTQELEAWWNSHAQPAFK